MIQKFINYCKDFFTLDYLFKISVICLLAGCFKANISLESHYSLGLITGIAISVVNNIHITKLNKK